VTPITERPPRDRYARASVPQHNLRYRLVFALLLSALAGAIMLVEGTGHGSLLLHGSMWPHSVVGWLVAPRR